MTSETLTNATRVNFWDQRNNTIKHVKRNATRELNQTNQFYTFNYYSKTNETHTDNIYTYEHLFTRTHFADKKKVN